ncbi:hypothetical protein P170DRAFT_422559 [Aspergillus steynii IBT 23096]|uniref:Uncharacterized protein n=1 Tax=Aspergillus steynii IBT 23096 TaxID=1392250 RepID=A0A2I2GFB3_9EURO|nr:uncharacterized protein P170DRAFT_422559 [Aspergillus steynii IBT 23096]PLB51551.1 hypothetical protein P170DRAFT_422559 [Aspergillus steynii IBT 23096]
MGKRRASAGATSRVKFGSQRKPEQSTPKATMAPKSGEDYEKPSQVESGRRRSSRLNPDLPAASRVSDQSPQTTTEKHDPDCHHANDEESSDEQFSAYDSDPPGMMPSVVAAGRQEEEPCCHLGIWNLHNDCERACIQYAAEQWVYNHCVGEKEVVERTILASEKQAIMDGLEGWCLYKDWDELASALPDNIRDLMPEYLARALISKDIIETIMKNPFFYMDLGDDSSGEADDLAPTLGIDLYHLWQKLIKVDRPQAHHWREQTVHLMNKLRPIQTRDSSVGVRSLRLRRRIARHLATKMLSKSSLLYPLIKKDVDDRKKAERFRWMVRIYRDAAKKSVMFWVDECGYEFHHDIHQVGLSDENSQFYQLEPQSFFACMDNPNGRRAVLLLAPLVWQLQFGFEPVTQEMLDDDCTPDPVDEDGHPNSVVCRGQIVVSKDVEPKQAE